VTAEVPLPYGWHLLACPHMVEGSNKLPQTSFMKTKISFMGAVPYMTLSYYISLSRHAHWKPTFFCDKHILLTSYKQIYKYTFITSSSLFLYIFWLRWKNCSFFPLRLNLCIGTI
jgi:hypothetical protein